MLKQLSGKLNELYPGIVSDLLFILTSIERLTKQQSQLESRELRTGQRNLDAKPIPANSILTLKRRFVSNFRGSQRPRLFWTLRGIDIFGEPSINSMAKFQLQIPIFCLGG
jgi:hypothetical protein